MFDKTTCLLVDDDPDDIDIFNYALHAIDEKIHCITANNGEDALFKLQSNLEFLPDMIFLDLNMPRMNGIECLRKLRQIPRLDRIPIVMFSTSNTDRDINETMNLGAAHFLTKPCSISSLVNSLVELFRRKDLYRSPR